MIVHSAQPDALKQTFVNVNLKTTPVARVFGEATEITQKTLRASIS